MEPLAVEEVDPSTLVESPLIFDTQRGTVLAAETAAFRDAQNAFAGRARSYSVDAATGMGELAYYDARTDRWLKLATTSRVRSLVFSNDGRLGVAEMENGLWFLGLEAGTQQRLGISGSQVTFSPDGARIALRTDPVRNDESPYVIYPIANPGAAVRLPLGQSPISLSPFGLRWLDDTRVLVMNQRPYLVQIFDVSGTPRPVLEEIVESDQIAVSPDGTHLAVQVRAADNTPVGIALYTLQPFRRIGENPGASLGNQLDVKSGVWSVDNGRILGVREMCDEQNERLVAYAPASGAEAEIVRDGMMTFVFSPDGRWVAYTSWPRNGFVISTSGNAGPVLVDNNVAAPMAPQWSLDSRYVTFNPFFGGYDRCIV